MHFVTETKQDCFQNTALALDAFFYLLENQQIFFLTLNLLVLLALLKHQVSTIVLMSVI